MDTIANLQLHTVVKIDFGFFPKAPSTAAGRKLEEDLLAAEALRAVNAWLYEADDSES